MTNVRTERQKRRSARWLMKKSPMKAYVLLALMLISTVSTVRASGDLKNTGTINNTGQVRVQNAATGLPASNGGVYEFFGASQTIPGRQYVDLKLSGSGTKTIDADATVTGSLTVATGVTYSTGTFITHLAGTLTEQGYVMGKMDKSVNLTGGLGTSTFGNIGASISWSGTAPGNTTVLRSSGTALTSAATGKSSIKRYYDITPATNTGLNATLVFGYADAELNGQAASGLNLWKSTDGGLTWRNQGGTVDVVQHTITKTGVNSFSRWTATDAANPLGLMSVEGVAEHMAISMGNGQTGVISTTLPMQLIVTTSDAYGNPVKNTAVTFAITGVPSGAAGQKLSIINTVTDDLGQANTMLTLGDKPGVYSVNASSPFISGSDVTFSATGVKPATVSVATTLALTSGNNQAGEAYTSLAQPYVVTILDQLGVPMAGVPVKFALSGSPAGATGQKLADTLVTTNASGQAQTTLRLGTKAGQYVVSATSGSLAGSPVSFTSKAVAAAAANMTLPLGSGFAGQVLQTVLPAVVVQITDTYGNPISGASVHYVLTSSPTGATGTFPQDVTVATDSLGRSQVSVVLGSKAGVYSFQVSVGSLPPQTITVTATSGQTGTGTVATRLLQTSGNGQSGVVATQLATPFVVTVVDTASNPVSGVSVRFALGTSPLASTGRSLTDTLVTTDQNGQARSFLRLGTRTGQYTVTASSGSLLGSPVTFTANAIAGVPARLVALSGDRQSSPVGTVLSQPFVVQVTDNQLNPVGGVAVNFSIAGTPANATGQTLDASQRSTDSQGITSVTLTLGNTAGDYRVEATSPFIAGGIASFVGTATSTGSVARALLLSSGQNQRGVVRSILPAPFVVRTVDADNNPVSGITVQFAIDTIPTGASGQRLSTVSATSDLLGYASTLLTFGDLTGTYTVLATSPGLTTSPVTLRAVATLASGACSMVCTSGGGQNGAVLSQLASPLIVTVYDAAGNPVAGQTVTFAVDSLPPGATGHVITPSSATTDAQGRAIATMTLGNLTGVYRVSATVPGIGGGPLELRVVATLASGAYRMVYTSGDAQSGGVLSQLSSPLVATVLGVDGNPVSGQPVTFAIDSLPQGASGYVLSQSLAVTNGQGRASVVMTLGSKIGVYRVRASVAGLSGSPVAFNMTSTLGLPKALALVQGTGQSKPIGTALDNAFVVRAVDAGQNPVPGVTVQFSLDTIPNGTTGQSLKVINAVTDAQGQSQAILTLGNKVGGYSVSASSIGLDGSPVHFNARATVGAPAVVTLNSGDGQSAPVSTELLLPFVVTVADIGGNAIAGNTVSFAIETTPSAAKGQSLRVVNGVTDASGRASAYLTLGDRDGHYTVTATVNGLAPVRFNSTATLMVGDINGNNSLDIADLTTVIDYLLGKITLTGTDSIKADYNRDGHIDIRDVVAMQNALLAVDVSSGKPAGVNSVQSVAVDTAGSIAGEFVLTDNGVRFNLTNSVPVKGLQLIIRFKDAQTMVQPDEIFDRARVDSFYSNMSGRELRIVAYNLGNIPIREGDGTLFRLPLKLTDVSSIELGQMIVSRTNNTAYYDEALAKNTPVRLVKPQDLPTSFVLYQNYPNPFNGQTNISYDVMDVAGMAEVSVQVFNVLGEKVKTFATERHAGGRFMLRWDGTDDRGTKLSSGTYFYRLISGSFVSSKKMIMLK